MRSPGELFLPQAVQLGPKEESYLHLPGVQANHLPVGALRKAPQDVAGVGAVLCRGAFSLEGGLWGFGGGSSSLQSSNQVFSQHTWALRALSVWGEEESENVMVLALWSLLRKHEFGQ